MMLDSNTCMNGATAKAFLEHDFNQCFAQLRHHDSQLRVRSDMISGLEGEPYVDYIANPLWHEPFGTRIFTATKVWGYALLLTLFPFELACTYGAGVFDLVTVPLETGFLISLVCLLAILIGGVRALFRQPLLFLAATTFLGFSFVTSNVPIRMVWLST